MVEQPQSKSGKVVGSIPTETPRNMGDNLFIIRFPLYAHGFKLSASYRNKLYYYREDYKMDVMEVPSKKWVIRSVEETNVNIVVTLIEIK